MRSSRSYGSVRLLAAVFLLLALSISARAEDSGTQPPPTVSGWCGTQILYDQKAQMLGLPADPDACTQRGPCDNPGMRDQWVSDTEGPFTIIRLFIHILRNDDGSNAITTPEEVQIHVDQLNVEYLPSHIQFVWDYDYVNSTAWRTLQEGAINAMKASTAVDPHLQLNVWVTTVNFDYSFGTFPWDSDALSWSGGIVMGHFHWVGGPYTTFAHEIGHCLGLAHTFNGVEEVEECGPCYEYVNAPDRDVLGDRCSDTPPTPEHQACSNAPGVDPCTALPWGYTMPENLMGYTPQTCRNMFTEQQNNRMHCWLFDELLGWVVSFYDSYPNFGRAPLTVDFTGQTFGSLTEWSWDFGDGHTSEELTPTHTYEEPGYYTVGVSVETPLGPLTSAQPGLVSVHADTIRATDVVGHSGQAIRVDFYVRNYLPLNEIILPFTWAGPFNLTYDSVSTQGLRTEYFEEQHTINYDANNKRLTFRLRSSTTGTVPFLSADTGAVLSAFFWIPSFVKEGSNQIAIISYGSYQPKFVAAAGEYTPTEIDGTMTVSCCKNRVGNVDNDFLDGVDLADLTALIDYLFISFEEPACLEEANCDGDPAVSIDLSDLTRLIDYLFISFENLDYCP